MIKMIKLAKKGIFIYNSFHRRNLCFGLKAHPYGLCTKSHYKTGNRKDMRFIMFNMHNRKTKKIISSVIILIIVIAMLIPTLSYFIF